MFKYEPLRIKASAAETAWMNIEKKGVPRELVLSEETLGERKVEDKKTVLWLAHSCH